MKTAKKNLETMMALQKTHDDLLNEEVKIRKKRFADMSKIEKKALELGIWHPVSVLSKYCNQAERKLKKGRCVYPKNAATLDEVQIVYLDKATKKPKILDIDCETSEIYKDGSFSTTDEYWGLFYGANEDKKECYRLQYGSVTIYGELVGILSARLHMWEDYNIEVKIEPPWVKDE